jgi:hypothetical protein
MDIDKTVGNDNQSDKTEDDALAQALAMSSASEARVRNILVIYVHYLSLKFNYYL